MSVDYSNDLILITCASGKQAAFLLPILVNKYKKLRLAVNSQASKERLEKEYSNVDVFQADLTEPQDCRKLLEGVTALYHIGPPMHPKETEIGYNTIDAAVAQGSSFKHFVFSSVLNTQLRKMFNHDCKRYVLTSSVKEEYLFESGLNYTVLNPSNFADTFPFQQAFDTGVCTKPWNADTKSSLTCLYDLGEVASIVLNEREKHYLAQYQIVSTRPFSFRAQASQASEILEKDVKVDILPYDVTMGEDAHKILGLGPHPYTKDGVRRLLLYYNYHGLLGSPNVARWILGREPMSFDEWLLGRLAAFKGEHFDFLEARKIAKS